MEQIEALVSAGESFESDLDQGDFGSRAENTGKPLQNKRIHFRVRRGYRPTLRLPPAEDVPGEDTLSSWWTACLQKDDLFQRTNDSCNNSVSWNFDRHRV